MVQFGQAATAARTVGGMCAAHRACASTRAPAKAQHQDVATVKHSDPPLDSDSGHTATQPESGREQPSSASAAISLRRTRGGCCSEASYGRRTERESRTFNGAAIWCSICGDVDTPSGARFYYSSGSKQQASSCFKPGLPTADLEPASTGCRTCGTRLARTLPSTGTKRRGTARELGQHFLTVLQKLLPNQRPRIRRVCPGSGPGPQPRSRADSCA
eukprot:1778555-Rhodomonas_salina.3